MKDYSLSSACMRGYHTNILVACEESQAVCKAFRDRGFNAYSCDIISSSGGRPEWHIQHNVLEIINGDCDFVTEDGTRHKQIGPWDMVIGFPPCTYLTNAGVVRMRVRGEIQADRYEKAMEARQFFLRILNCSAANVAVENPTPMKLVNLPPYTQAIQPWMHGHPYTKRTCLWLRNLPLLRPTDVISEGITPYVNGGSKDSKGNYRRFTGKVNDPKIRSKTFPGIARAMAKQWGDYIMKEA